MPEQSIDRIVIDEAIAVVVQPVALLYGRGIDGRIGIITVGAARRDRGVAVAVFIGPRHRVIVITSGVIVIAHGVIVVASGVIVVTSGVVIITCAVIVIASGVVVVAWAVVVVAYTCGSRCAARVIAIGRTILVVVYAVVTFTGSITFYFNVPF